MSEKIQKRFELDFLWEISKVLGNNFVPEDIVLGLRNVFEKFFKINNFKVFIYDEISDSLRDFRKEWCIISDKNTRPNYINQFKQLSSSVRHRFIINDSFFVLNDDFNCLPDMEFENEKNWVYLPIVHGPNTIGMIEVVLSELNKKFLSKEFLAALSIATSQISASIINYKLNTRMAKNTEFYRAMKNIAKILENQYELSYIIPMIGEMLDRFVSEHFIYIFNKEGDEFKLLWPVKYNEKRINPFFEDLDKVKDVIISESKKIAVFPLEFDNELKGAIVADGKYNKITETEISYLKQLTKQASITIDRASTYAEIQKHATTDALTGLNNRRQLETKLKQEIAVAQRKAMPLCSMMLDIDYFKQVNDNYGHSAGDIVLKEFAKIIKEEIREYDFPVRYGGEEFFILLPSATVEEANAVAKRLKERIEKDEIDISSAGEDKNILITTSIGISQYEDTQTLKQFCANADKALYQAKQEGRNRIVVWGE